MGLRLSLLVCFFRMLNLCEMVYGDRPSAGLSSDEEIGFSWIWARVEFGSVMCRVGRKEEP